VSAAGALLRRAWLRRGPIAWLLLPVTLAYACASALHRALYRFGVRTTPVAIAIVQHLQGRGLQVGVISRGYGRAARDCQEVTAASEASAVGDEPLLIHRRTGAPVVVAASRADAARHLLAAHPAVRVLVSDDGLQHHALARDIEVCVFDTRGTGNGWLLPSGPLREAWPRSVDFVLRPASLAALGGHAVVRALGDAVRADGQRRPLAGFAGAPVDAMAGIADPEAFFAMLRAAGLDLAITLPLPDHHAFDGSEAPAVARPLLVTEKDAVKLWRFRPDAWAVPLAVEVDAAFWPAFDAALAAKLSSPHGSQTA
jgi:tetraacyldisaccharide 4'-kinase